MFYTCGDVRNVGRGQQLMKVANSIRYERLDGKDAGFFLQLLGGSRSGMDVQQLLLQLAFQPADLLLGGPAFGSALVLNLYHLVQGLDEA